MRQTSDEKMDPLIRIQEEIKEVVRREQEHRQLTSAVSMNGLNDDFPEDGDDTNNNNNDNDNNNNLKSLGSSTDISLTINPHEDPHDIQKAVLANVVATSLRVHDDTPSLASSVNSKDSLDEHHHSDDSGISASSSPINGISANKAKDEYVKAIATPTTPSVGRENRYIGPNCYNLTPEPPQQKLMTRTVSTPHLAVTKPRQFTFSPAHKGVMQRFIASRGKLQLSPSPGSPGVVSASNPILLNSKHAAALLSGGATTPGTPSPSAPLSGGILGGGEFTPFAGQNPTVIERDAEGRPIRPGYVPVELKIQRELKDLKSRETELKKIRKIRQSTPDLLDSIDNENIETDSEDSEVEHCYGPGKLRTAKSISELCDTPQAFNTAAQRITPSPDFDSKLQAASNRSNLTQSNGMRPAVSLAQLCDLGAEEAPSSHRLIAQWESLIQQNA